MGPGWVEGEGLGDGSGMGAGGSACRVAWRRGVGIVMVVSAGRMGADFVVAFWAGMDGGSAGAAGAGGDGLSAGDGEGVSGR